MQRNLSSFAGKLSKKAKTRYKKKIGIIGGLDRFERRVERRVHQYIEASDLVDYLVLEKFWTPNNSRHGSF